ncbi:MAG: T9SS type A sorting domain-containing protein [Bacteroidetes bacterium]|nr:T9SS type A sorting domain-containing protein [Bacteroidota bacterium]
MKKLFLLLFAATTAMAVNAQWKMHTAPQSSAPNDRFEPGRMVPGSEQMSLTPEMRAQAKGTNAVIGSVQTFPGPALPTGWIATPVTNIQTFKHIDSSLNWIPVPHTPSAADGWVGIDANSNNNVAAEATLSSATYNLTGHTHVGLVFNTWFKRFKDSCVVDVSTDGGASWPTHYQVFLNNTIATNAYTKNTDTVVIDISAGIAANPANVQIRFHYYAPGNAYGWAIDDVRFVDLDAINMVLHRSVVVYIRDTANNFATPMGSMPIQFITNPPIDLVPITFLCNQGYTAAASQAVGVNITGGAPSYSQSLSTPLQVNGYDSAIDYGNTPYHPTSSALYTSVFTATNGAFTAHDSVRFAVSDSSWMGSDPRGLTNGAYWLHRPSTANGGEESWNYGADFIVPLGHSDTLTSANVVFYYKTNVGARIQVQIWKFDPNITPKWNVVGVTYVKTLDTNDISPQGTPTWSGNFYADPVASNGPIILDGGSNGTTYAAVITTDHVPADMPVSFYTAEPAGFTGMWGTLAAQDSSLNDASNVTGPGSFGTNLQNTNADHLPWSNQEVPMIRLNFGNYYTMPSAGVVNQTNGIQVAKVYPNPATNTVNISFATVATGKITVELQNMLGQVMKTQELDNIQKDQLANATFGTNDMPNGVYLYSIHANGEVKTGRFVIAH